MEYITLTSGNVVLKSDYITAKTKDLIEFGFAKLSEREVQYQVDKILKGKNDLNIIGRFCEEDIDTSKTNKK